ncbi:type II toxin-antitoxin system HipA family toxin [soil metagenome]
MTSNRVYVWTWLADREDPVVAGALDPVADRLHFVYGRSYLERSDAVPLYLPEVPLQPGDQPPPDGMDLAGCLADGAPDAWGRRIILRRLHSGDSRDVDTAVLPTVTYLLDSGTDRIGANDFQGSAETYVPRETDATLEELLAAADRLQAGEPFSEEIDRVLNAGSSVGGARPKATVTAADGRALIAKFSTPTDTYPVVKGEAVAMELARRAGLNVAATQRVTVLDRDVLLVDRFDRLPGTRRRRALVSALTLLSLSEMHARYATYPDLAQTIRTRFTDPRTTLVELYGRLVFNILIGNRDDHARNHAALWDGRDLALTPAYDLDPQPRDTGEATQAMALTRAGDRRSRLATCIQAASEFLLSQAEARDIVDRLVQTIIEEFDDAANTVGLTDVDRKLLWRRAFLHPYAFEGYAHAPA